jgi:8-hydroxy-5-deazaflavin:NADPH oxidoreductase
MDIAILGTGRVGGTLGIRWAQHGHRITYGVRDPAAAEVRDVLRQSPGATATTLAAAAQAHEIVLLAFPWTVTQDVLASLGSLSGKILLDCINPISSDLKRLEVGFSTSAAEQVAAWAPGARVVKAFNTVSNSSMADPRFHGERAAMFYCGDDEPAKAVVRSLAAELDLEPVDAGPLQNARYLEPLAMLYIDLAVFRGWGDCAFRIVKR